MDVKFTHNENIKGIYFAISENAETDYAKVRALIQGLNVIETKFNNVRINLQISSLVKKIIVIKGNKEKKAINKIFNYYENWKAFFVKQIDVIVFDLSQFDTSQEILNTFVHEIGHAIHTRFITPDAENYSSSISKKYVEVIRILKTFKDDIESYYDNEEMQEEFEEEALDYFNSFIQFLKDSVDPRNFEKNEEPVSNLAKSIYKKYISSDRFTCHQSVSNMINAIMEYIPSDYGSTNEYEYFAECFRKFILSPDELTQNNRNMVINTLTMSRSQGKELMQAHKVLKDYIKIILN